MGELLYANDIHLTEQAKIDAARLTQKSGNEKRGAQAELQRDAAALGNRRMMDAAGKTINAMSENIAKNLDAATSGTFENRIAAAEELGSNVALAAAAGVGGSSVEAYNETLRLRQSMQEESNTRAVNSDNINASAARGDTLIDAVGKLDNNVYAANQDFTQYVDHHKMGALTRIGTIGVAAAATYFGGPQAGMAVVGVAEGAQAAANGDYRGATKDFEGALQNGIAGVQAYRVGLKPKVNPAPEPNNTDASIFRWGSVDKINSGANLKLWRTTAPSY